MFYHFLSKFYNLNNNYFGTLNMIHTTIATKVIAFTAFIIAILIPVLAPPAFATVGRRLLGAEILNSARTGFLAGCLHTLSGPDHLAALAPLSIGRTHLESAAVRALWGCGRDAGQVIFGLLFLLLKDHLHIEILHTLGTRMVALTLICIGVTGIKESSAPCVALDCNVSLYEKTPDKAAAERKKMGFLATFATGIVHGFEPDALVMLLPALALPYRFAGAAFLLMFLLGTVVSMGSYTVFIGSCSLALKKRIPQITEKMTWASSFIAVALGSSILISQCLGLDLY